ncbi:aspartate aminotransferase family protein [Rhizobium mongolense]|uniref:aspartate aminotransferase family protein n=1 Tax=Rhizobium mongolense TaxID=57676 RepID=UPI0034A2D8EA
MTRSQSHLFYQSGTRRPLLDHASGIYLWDKSGKRYLDGSSGAMVSNIGHSNPNVQEAMRKQMELSTFGYRLHFENEPAEALASAISAKMPAGLDRVFFVSGGSEAVESCIKLARQYALAVGEAQRWKVISRFPSYHGSTLGALSLTGMSLMSAPFAPMMREMPKIAAPTCYLDRDPLTEAERGLKYARLLREEILRQGPETVLAFIMEPVGGASTGALVAPDSYYQEIRKICDEFGVLLISDEVMSGMGRTGGYLAMQHWSVRPDIVALSKGFGAGYVPLGAMVADRTIVEKVLGSGGFIHGFTYAGNPLACAAGLAVMQEIERLHLLEAATVQGGKLRNALMALMDRFAFIGDVRGKGLLLAFELVADRETMTPLPAALNAHTRLVDIAYDKGLIIYSRRTRGGRIGDHFMICPPLIIDDEQLDELITTLAESLDVFGAEAGGALPGIGGILRRIIPAAT